VFRLLGETDLVDSVSGFIYYYVVTASTIGYGDMSPSTDAGKLFTAVYIIPIAFQGVLNALVIDTDNDHNTNGTAARVAKMYLRETFSGRYEQAPSITEFPNVANYDGIYVTGPIEVRSTCSTVMLSPLSK
jgi:hypothetical protein